MKKKNENTIPVDNDLLFDIQPQGGISFKEPRYIITGSGYEMCIHIYEFPSKLRKHWLSKVCNINGAITIIDVSTDDIVEVKKNINKSIAEQNSRINTSNGYGDGYAAVQRVHEMQELYRQIESMGEVIKLIHIRIFMADRVLSKLEERVANTMKLLEADQFKPTIFLNEGKDEWQSMYRTYTQQQQLYFAIPGQEITAKGLAGGNPFHFSDLEDPCGTFLGTTPCGGNVLFDNFTKTDSRKFYNLLAAGTMGTGKSTLCKKLFEDRAARGDFVRTFDIAHEFEEITKEFGGKYITYDGTGKWIINPLQILRAGENEIVNFTLHISKVMNLYETINLGITREELQEFQELLTDFYDAMGFKPDGNKEKEISGLPPIKYPVFSDFLRYIINAMETLQSKTGTELEHELLKERLLGMERVRKSISNIVNTYGQFFDKHTTIESIVDEQIITFDISKLKDMRVEIFDAIVLNLLSLCYDNCVTNGSIMKERYEREEIGFDDVIRFLIILDESHRFINTSKIPILRQVLVYMREARKFFGGIILASQSIRDYVPEESKAEGLDTLKSIFELTLYKFIFQQDNNAISLIDRIFGEELTLTQKQRIPKLQMGECILSIASYKGIEFKVYLSPAERRIFAGGA